MRTREKRQVLIAVADTVVWLKFCGILIVFDEVSVDY